MSRRFRAGLVMLVSLGLFTTVLASGASAGTESISQVVSFNGSDSAGPAMVLDADDNPVIAFVRPTDNRLMILRCNDAACVGGGETLLGESQLSGMGWPSIALTTEGYPVVAYTDGSQLNVLRCNDRSCNGSDALNGVATDTIGFPSVQVTSDNKPVVAFVTGDLELGVVTCTTFNCNGHQTAIPVSGQQMGSAPSLQLDPLDRPVIGHTLAHTDYLQLVRCQSKSCNTGASTTRANNEFWTADLELVHNDDGSYEVLLGSLQLPAGGLEEGAGFPLMHVCNADCSQLVHIETPRALNGRSPWSADFAYGPNGVVIAFSDFDVTGRLLVMSMDQETVPNEFNDRESRTVAPDPGSLGPQHPALRINSDGHPVIATVVDAGIRVIVCDDVGCVPTCNGQLVDLDAAAGEPGVFFAQSGDVVRGTNGPDHIKGGSVVCGLGGNDIIEADGGSFVFGGAGNDRISADTGNNFFSGGPGNDVLIGGFGRDRLFGGPGADRLDGGSRGDRLSGGDGNDTIFGSTGDDKIFGNLGRDTIDGGPGNDIIKAGAWIDTVDGGEGDDDRCGIVAGEIRINCERGVFGI